MSKPKEFTPDWTENVPLQGSYRSIFKWGGKDQFKNPSAGFFKVIKESLNLSDDDFKQKTTTGDEKVEFKKDITLLDDDLSLLVEIVGRDNVAFDSFSRVKYGSGNSMEDILKLRNSVTENLPDIVLHPRNKEDVEKIVSFCNQKKIGVNVYAGGSSVTLGLACEHGGVVLVMGTHMNQVVEFNETDQTITVQAGMMGPVYEDLLNNAPEKLGAKKRYTGGHFPQSFEYSSVGGWVVTLGAGQASSYYGDACDLVMSQEYITPAGSFKTLNYPGTATGPKVNDIMKGSEGCFGVLVSVTMKVFQYFPENTRAFAFIFPDFKSAVNASREISQSESGMPSILRISDPEESDVAMKMYGLEGSILDSFIKFKDFKPGRRCILMGQADGEKGFTKLVKSSVKKICKKNRGMYITGYPMKKWHHGRFKDPYMRDVLNDYGILIDTLETSVTWDNLELLYKKVRSFIKQNPDTICMTHASHFYAQGTNLYFIFITKMDDLDKFKKFQQGIIAQIAANKGSLSHHHGVGRMMAPFMKEHLGEEQVNVLKALKKHFDPNNIMNPGTTLGLN
ncbi:MAG: FAD-binding oxidoreductase [Thermodesulfobacteriota bacterium]|nr:FAD-binding oxidoreductase [Thermodesulfobacteriota bacterium]